MVVDSSPLDQAPGNKNDLAYCSAPDDRAMYQQKVSLDQISSEESWGGRHPNGRWIGMLRARGAGRRHLLEARAPGTKAVALLRDPAAWQTQDWSARLDNVETAAGSVFDIDDWADKLPALSGIFHFAALVRHSRIDADEEVRHGGGHVG